MAVLPGLIGTGDWASNDFPENWRTTLLRLKPDAKAALTMIMGLTKTESLDAPIHHWAEKGIRQMVFQSDAATAAATTITWKGTNPLKPIRNGHVMCNTRTQEIIWVDETPASPWTSLTVIRGDNCGSTSAVVNDGDYWILVSSRHEEGAAVPDSVFRSPDWLVNYTQIFRTPIKVTGTAKVTALRYAKQGPTDEMLRDALEDHYTEVESQGIWGVPYAGTGGAGDPERTTGGMTHFVTTNAVDFGASFTLSDFLDALRLAFKYGSSRKLALMGDQALLTLMSFCLQSSTFNLDANTRAWGLNIQRLITPFGTLLIKKHDLLTESQDYSDWGLIIDTDHVRLRPLRERDTHLRPNEVKDGADAETSEYLSELSWEWQLEKTHAIWENFTGFSA